jgi:hypothetical protein
MLEVGQLAGEVLRGTPKKNQAHAAGLKRLSARASAGPSTPPGSRRVFFSFSAYARSVINQLKKCEVPIAEGLSDEEFERIEATFGFTFPPDLKGILQEGLPVGAGFPNWRTGNVEQLRMRINLPVLGILQEVAQSSFWWKPWGARPVDVHQAIRSARSALRKFPVLIPMYGHCYIPTTPNLAGNPVFFAYQKYVLCCGYDVADFFEREAFLVRDSEPFDFDNWSDDTGSNRSLLSNDSGAGKGRPYHTDVDSLHRSSNSSSGTDLSETSGSGSSELGQGETWGRSLDVLAKNTGSLCGSPRTGRSPSGFERLKCRLASRQLKFTKSFDQRSQEPESPRVAEFPDDLFKYSYMIEKPLSTKTLIHFSTLMMPQWSARTPRRIEFWSDLAEKQQQKQTQTQTPVPNNAEGLYSPRKVEYDPLYSIKGHPERKDLFAAKSSKWLHGYLEEMSVVLRQGGWREDDISDMMDFKPSPRPWNQRLEAHVRNKCEFPNSLIPRIYYHLQINCYIVWILQFQNFL